MRLSGLAVAVILSCSTAVFAQHSSAGSSSGGSSGGSSFSGSSHGSSFSSGSSAGSSSGSHSSGGSVGHSASAGSSRSSSGAPSSRAGNLNSSAKGSVQPPKNSFVSHLFHPFRKAEPKLAASNLRFPVCSKGHCVCPGGQAAGHGGACSAPPTRAQECRSGTYWNGGGCLVFSEFQANDCSALARFMDEQAQSMRMAEDLRQGSCSRDAAAQECGELTARSMDEATRYKTLQRQYEQCRRQQFARGRNGYSFGSYAEAGLWNPFSLE